MFLQAVLTQIMIMRTTTETIVVGTKLMQNPVAIMMMTTLMQMKCAVCVRVKVIFSSYPNFYIRNNTCFIV